MISLGRPTPTFSYRAHADLVEQARDAGLGVTIHTGEEGRVEDMWEVVEYLRPDRIGHGILCVYDEKLMRRVAEAGIVLEVCPTSNLRTRAVRDVAEVRHMLDTLRANGVPFTINTDGPDMLMTTILKEYQFLLQQGIFTDADVVSCNQTAIDASFLNRTCPVEI